MRHVVSRRSIARRLFRLLRTIVVVAMIVDVLFPAHAVAAVAASMGEHAIVAHDDAGANHPDDGCPDDCAACPCLHLRCVPPSWPALLELNDLPGDPLPAATPCRFHVTSGHLDRLERPPRI